GVLDGAAHQADRGGQPDGLGRRGRRVREALLEIRAHRQIGRLRDGAAMREGLLARHLAVAAAERAGLGAARGGERLEAERGEDARGAGVPRVRNRECPRRLVEGTEAGGLLALADGHDGPPWTADILVHPCPTFWTLCRPRAAP